jgi:hypothetical protein
MEGDMHNFSDHSKFYAQDKAQTRSAEPFLTIDQDWIIAQLANTEIKTLIIDNRSDARKFFVGADKTTNCQALTIQNPTGEDLTRLGLLIRQGHGHIHHLKFINLKTKIYAMLLNAFLWRPLASLYLKKISEELMIEIIERIESNKALLALVIANHQTPEIMERVATNNMFSIGTFRLCDCSVSEPILRKVLAVENWAIASDDEQSDEANRSKFHP